MSNAAAFDPECRSCDRLARYLDSVSREFPAYHARPVPAFGAEKPRLLIVGLAPGLHGANATGRPFTGDHAGILLYRTLHKFGFASAAESTGQDDGLRLQGCRITNAVKCVPPQNKPATAEIRTCNRFLRTELRQLPAGTVILALGTIAHAAVLQAMDQKPALCKFGHGRVFGLPNRIHLIDSYHCSRYNTQTGRLTAAMFEDVFKQIADLLRATAAD